jgi:hypothetical protein
MYSSKIISVAMAETAGFKVRGGEGYFSENIFLRSRSLYS